MSKTTSQRLVECICELQHQVVFEHAQKFFIIWIVIGFQPPLIEWWKISDILRECGALKNE